MLKRKVFPILVGLLIGCLAGYAAIVTVAWLNPPMLPVQEARAEVPDRSLYAPVEDVQEAFRVVSAEILPTIVEVSVKTEGLLEQTDDKELPWNEFFQNPLDDSEGPRYYQSQGPRSGTCRLGVHLSAEPRGVLRLKGNPP